MNQQNDFYQATPVVKNAAYFRSRAREALRGFYLYALIAFLIASFLGGVIGGGAGVSVPTNTNTGTNVEGDAAIPEEVAAEIRTFVDTVQTGDIGRIVEAYPALIIAAVAVVIGIVFGIAFSLFISSPVTVGYQRYNLNLMDGKDQRDFGVLFRYFKVSYGKTIGLRVLYSLLSFVCALPSLALLFAAFWCNRGAFWGLLTGDVSEHHLLGVLAAFAMMCAALVLGIVINILVFSRFQFCFMILAEYPQLSVTDALRNSASLMRGKVWKLFCLRMSFFGWYLLGTLACGIGIIFLMPYVQAADAAFYDEIANRAAARETEFPSLDPKDYFIN